MKLLGCKGTTGTQESFMKLFKDEEKVKQIDGKIAEKWDLIKYIRCIRTNLYKKIRFKSIKCIITNCTKCTQNLQMI